MLLGPFGEPLRAIDPMAAVNPFRFSTKYQDNDTGLLYYGCRYCQVSSGRWLSRDPSQEGGIHIYAFCYNSPSVYVDDIGREPAIYPPPGGAGPWLPPGSKPPPPPLGNGPYLPTPPNAKSYTLDLGGLKLRWCCVDGQLFSVAIGPIGTAEHFVKGPGGSGLMTSANTAVGVCCNAKYTKLQFSKQVTYWPGDIAGLFYTVQFKYLVVDDSGHAVSSDATSQTVPQAMLDQFLRNKNLVDPSTLDNLRSAFNKLSPILCGGTK